MYKTIDEVPREDIWDAYYSEHCDAQNADEEWKNECISEIIDACRDPFRAHVHIGHWGMFRDSSDRQEDCCDYALIMLDHLDVDGFRYSDMAESMGVIDLKKLVLLGVRHVDLYEALRAIEEQK